MEFQRNRKRTATAPSYRWVAPVGLTGQLCTVELLAFALPQKAGVTGQEVDHTQRCGKYIALLVHFIDFLDILLQPKVEPAPTPLLYNHG